MKGKSYSGVRPFCSYLVVILCILSFCVLMILNALFSKSLFARGMNFIHDYQQAQPYPIVIVIQNLFSFLCNKRGYALVFLFFYLAVRKKLLMLIHISYFLLGLCFIDILKQTFQEQRPLTVDDRIQNWEWFCPHNFGNPSGHSFSVFPVYEPLISDVVGFGSYYLGWVFLFVIGVMVPISRMYLGVHSVNQILLGLAIGLMLLLVYRYLFQKVLYNFFWSLLNKKKISSKIKIVILNIILLIVPIIIFYIQVNHNPLSQKDIDQINKNCGLSKKPLDLQEEAMRDTYKGFFIFGVCYGLLLLSKEDGYKKYFLGKWKYSSCINLIKKIFIILCSLVLAETIYHIGKGLTHHFMIRYIFKCGGMTFLGFGLAYLVPLVSLKYQIIELIEEEQEKKEEREEREKQEKKEEMEEREEQEEREEREREEKKEKEEYELG